MFTIAVSGPLPGVEDIRLVPPSREKGRLRTSGAHNGAIIGLDIPYFDFGVGGPFVPRGHNRAKLTTADGR